MRSGATRTDVPYIWPETLRHHPRPPKLVYLDLNHWIELAKALACHPDGTSFREVLDICLAARRCGAAAFPISDTIYVEVSKIHQHRQRRDIRNVIEELSGYAVVTARSIISTHEVEAMLDRFVGPNPQPIDTMDYLDWGVARAFGIVGGFKVLQASSDGGQDTDVTEEVRSSWSNGPEDFDAIFAAAELALQRQTLDGPRPAEEPEMRQLGWDPSGTIAIAMNRAQQEIEQVGRFNSDPRWRAGRIRDVVAAREVFIEINEILHRGLDERGASLEDVFGSPDVTRGQLDAMPSLDVAVTVKTEYHRDAHHRWTPNDIHDIDALGSTVPYCDIVVTDHAAAEQVNRRGLAERLDTVVLSRLSDLPALLV